jgi:hypothetical protein
MVEHTPGPWKVEPSSKHRDRLYVWDSDEWPNMVCIAEVKEGRYIGELRANAQLIAAAPDLLEAVKQFVRYAQNGNHPKWGSYLQTVAGQRMLDALKKGQGHV